MARTSAFAHQIRVLKADLHKSVAQTMARAAREAFAQAQAVNRAELGRDPPSERFVDGRRGSPLESVKPGGRIVYLFAVGGESLRDAVDEAARIFAEIAPVGRPPDPHPGLYVRSLALLVNGVRRDFATEGAAIEFKETDLVSLTDLVPYARKIEIGHMKMSVPNGVMQRVAQRLRRRFGNVLNIRFSFEHYPGFAVGRTRTGGALRTAKEMRRASSYPTITLSVR
jgi:phage gpG-like protein